jgi:hypothetical protein
VTCDAVLAKAGGGCLGIRRLFQKIENRGRPVSRRQTRQRMTSMKRAFVFLVLAPVSVFVIVFLLCVTIFGGKSADLAALCAMVLAVVTLPASVTAGLADGYLCILPISLRAYLTAMVGAAIATGEALVLFSSLLPPSIVLTLAIGGAVVMGACSLLSHDYSGQQWHSLEPASV